MGKRQKLRKEVERQRHTIAAMPTVGLKIGSHQLPVFDALSATWGARGPDYPSREAIPDQFYGGNTPYNRVFSTLFFKGGSLEQFGIRIKDGIDRAQAMMAIRSLLCSFDPKHEIKEATVAWALSEWCDGTPKFD
ncbi:hypothetical protein A6U86_05630 [Rhizobium sp. AC27/96]|uniref:hypothetical protein n=1 Tax=Rhizobium sp. AC27/96 TaxID=1841653 RepID=UPI0008286B7E|nr:hypothetical protein [Rhizobium sp. AC27/96]OCJ12503.1 hypothetical protein A6U86_05630 [Rhizobium sp. AC27/96]